MILRQETLDGIRTGTVTLAFRRWQRPSVRTGGTLLTRAGKLEIVAVDPVTEAAITEEAAERAGWATREDLLRDLNRRPAGELYRIEFGRLLPDPRVELRETIPTQPEIEEIADRLKNLDRRSPNGPWTLDTLEIVRRQPGVRAADLAKSMGMERAPFKLNVRKLKKLGLTESLEIGYCLSPRGEAVLDALRSA
ncbi:MAG: hypothetical protein GEU90_14570 [Gemmatimonas sp.]|nr:hypothetical protein [Gemmatimonas sp.]